MALRPPIEVRALTNADSVSLTLDRKPFGEQKVNAQHVASCKLPSLLEASRRLRTRRGRALPTANFPFDVQLSGGRILRLCNAPHRGQLTRRKPWPQACAAIASPGALPSTRSRRIRISCGSTPQPTVKIMGDKSPKAKDKNKKQNTATKNQKSNDASNKASANSTAAKKGK
jgi:hypothetical protein